MKYNLNDDLLKALMLILFALRRQAIDFSLTLEFAPFRIRLTNRVSNYEFYNITDAIAFCIHQQIESETLDFNK